MATIIFETGQVTIPEWVNDLESFRRWNETDDFPADGSIWWLRGEVWADMSAEQLFTHNLVKTRFFIVLGNLVDEGELGLFFSDGILLSNFAADISGKPDATFISHATLDAERVRLIEGARRGYVEIQGEPDMVLEVLSDSSEKKDRETLRQAYWDAGVREYWIVDAREEPIQFDILKHAPAGYVATRKPKGWVKSAVFGKSFLLMQELDARGRPKFVLSVR
jgi:Uma2 family endonuclease